MIVTLQEQYVELAELNPKTKKNNNDDLSGLYKVKVKGIFPSEFFDQFEDDKPLNLKDALYHKDGSKKRSIRGISLKGNAQQHIVKMSHKSGASVVSHEFTDAELTGFVARASEEGKISGAFWIFVEPSGAHSDKQILFLNDLLVHREFILEIKAPPPGANATQKDLELDKE